MGSICQVPVWSRRRYYVTPKQCRPKQCQRQRELRINKKVVWSTNMPSPSLTKLEYWNMRRVDVILRNTIRLEYEMPWIFEKHDRYQGHLVTLCRLEAWKYGDNGTCHWTTQWRTATARKGLCGNAASPTQR